MCLLWSTNWVFISQKTTFFIVTAVKNSNLTNKIQPHLSEETLTLNFRFWATVALSRITRRVIITNIILWRRWGMELLMELEHVAGCHRPRTKMALPWTFLHTAPHPEDGNVHNHWRHNIACYPVLTELTPWSWPVYQSPSVLQPLDGHPVLYGARTFITAVTTALHLSLSGATPIETPPIHHITPRSILMSTIH
jgi:hypothetical protein